MSVLSYFYPMQQRQHGRAGSRIFLIILFLAVAGTWLSSCKKDKLLTTGGDLAFSTDTLAFDTVFTTQGSFTLSVKLYNTQNQKINLSSVRLGNGATSMFRLNVDGHSGNDIQNLAIAAHDSIYAFVTVTIDPNADTTPFVVEDKLIATLNGTDHSIPIIAYGQNAYYITGVGGDSVLTSDQTWRTDKPYVIMHQAIVAEGVTLTIPAGARIYMHANAGLDVLGTLHAIGTKTDSIIFQGDRLDRSYFGYEGYPGEWGGLYFGSKSSNNMLTHVLLLNCGNTTSYQGSALYPAGIAVLPDSSAGPGPQLTLNKVTIQNSIGYGILSFNGTIRADNCLITDCGAQGLAIVQGGRDTFNNCTIATYGGTKISHTQNANAFILNYYKVNDVTYLHGDLHAVMRNCIFYGSLENELVCDALSGAGYDLTLDHCAVKADSIPSIVTGTSVLLNSDPMFTDVGKYDYHLKDGSPMIDAGTPLSFFADDLDDKVRTGNYDLGCYEH